MVGIQAIKHIGKALYGDEDAFLEVIDEEVCAAWQSNIWQCKSHKFQSAEVRTKV